MALDHIEDMIAKPGDPELDCHLMGLRLASIAPADTGTYDLECLLLFDTRQAQGSWTDSVTGKRVVPDTVTELTITFGVQMEEGYGHLAAAMLGRLEGWASACVPVEMFSAPGKWTLLRSPADEVVIPRSDATWTASPGDTDG